MRWFWPLVVVFAACDFPTPSETYACEIDADCESGRVCGPNGYCVVASTGNGGLDARVDSMSAPIDAPAAPDAPPDADPFVAIAMQCVAQGYTLVAAPNGYYRPVTSSATWLNAQADCKGDVAGATHLIVLSTPAEATYMLTKLGWIGLSDRITENTFVTVTGETGDQRPFSSGQPDNGSGSEDCVQMKNDGLDDDQCNSTHRYVCECDGRMSTP
jgi:hypothetical protein